MANRSALYHPEIHQAMTSVVFGNSALWAIEAASEPRTSHWLFGNIRFVARGYPIGDMEVTCVLTSPAVFLSNSLALTGKRINDQLLRLGDAELLRYLDDVLCQPSEGATVEELAAAEQQYRRFLICPGIGASFDEELAVLIEGKNFDRFVWRDRTDRSPRSVHLEKGYISGVVCEFLA
jgi:hypothetical protein